MPLILPDSWLRSALTSGAEKFTASALNAGLSVGRIYDRLVKKLGIPTRPVFENLIEFSESMLAAGELMRSIPAGSTIPLANMPMNPFLFGDDPGGRRQLWRTRVFLPSTEIWYTVDIVTPDIVSIIDLSFEIDAETGRRIGGSPEKFGGVDIVAPSPPIFEIIFGETRY